MNVKMIEVTIFLMIIQGYHTIIYPTDYASALYEDPTQVTFDFIVVGGGSAGATVAARLSEIPEWNVLLLEAGGDPPELTENPLLWTHNLRTQCDWSFLSEKNPSLFKGMEQERCIISRGFMLGGSSSINAMVYLRGTINDFSQWKNNYGCHGWGYEDVLLYFKKSEDFVDTSRYNPKIHSQGGPLTVTPFETFDPAYKIITDSQELINVIKLDDLNIIKPAVGYGNFDSTTRNGRRCSTLKAFLIPSSSRPNLYVAKYTIVTKVLIKDDVAVGVEFKCSSDEFKSVYCTKEVVICAGPIKSPQLLMLSGIGPKEHLNDHGIPTIKDLPVGFNLQDHMSLPALVFTDRKCRPMEDIINESGDLVKKEISLYSKNIATLGLTNLMTFYKSNDDLDYPDVQIINFRIPFNTTNTFPNKINVFTNMFGYAKEVTNVYDELNLLSDLIVMTPIILQPLSTGRVMLNSINPLDKPKIFLNYLSCDEEIETLLKGIEFIVTLSKTKSMIDAGLVLEELKLSNCADHIWDTRDYWICVIQNLAAPFYHVVGTCRMGSEDDSCSVVDPKLRVKGITGMRVIDSSVMPKIVSANTNAASIMIGEKGSDIIKECYGML
ncbi:LOW QUALITY PROTEIN: glucose dehydrogenase [FAD, quinone]-like [Rhopalosiphum maidis]|uniref:LOW QUALITY PROTEIN: glucose dehydrogenase [FAD, quinone]-like n=1 Tax=Rhopalosiphum maidis TaxID=43146 RepID=UPI000F00462B|nr:LOW QUALITY PROTEIN: glucose dehydrogenase [FAD, quinone]-like [Rhopalosiphum maidis]